MILHVALFQWKKDSSQDEIESALKEVKDHEHKIDGVSAIHVGENYSKWAKHYIHGVVVVAKNQKALDAYRQHPDHDIVAKKIDTMEQDGIGIDFKDLVRSEA